MDNVTVVPQKKSFEKKPKWQIAVMILLLCAMIILALMPIIRFMKVESTVCFYGYTFYYGEGTRGIFSELTNKELWLGDGFSSHFNAIEYADGFNMKARAVIELCLYFVYVTSMVAFLVLSQFFIVKGIISFIKGNYKAVIRITALMLCMFIAFIGIIRIVYSADIVTTSFKKIDDRKTAQSYADSNDDDSVHGHSSTNTDTDTSTNSSTHEHSSNYTNTDTSTTKGARSGSVAGDVIGTDTSTDTSNTNTDTTNTNTNIVTSDSAEGVTIILDGSEEVFNRYVGEVGSEEAFNRYLYVGDLQEMEKVYFSTPVTYSVSEFQGVSNNGVWVGGESFQVTLVGSSVTSDGIVDTANFSSNVLYGFYAALALIVAAAIVYTVANRKMIPLGYNKIRIIEKAIAFVTLTALLVQIGKGAFGSGIRLAFDYAETFVKLKKMFVSSSMSGVDIAIIVFLALGFRSLTVSLFNMDGKDKELYRGKPRMLIITILVSASLLLSLVCSIVYVDEIGYWEFTLQKPIIFASFIIATCIAYYLVKAVVIKELEENNVSESSPASESAQDTVIPVHNVEPIGVMTNEVITSENGFEVI